MSSRLAEKLRLGLQELSRVCAELTPLIDMPPASAGVIERSAACAMLHSFYTEMEKLFKLIAEEFDGGVPASESWHRDLLTQMATATDRRPAVLPSALLEPLREFLAFRHLFRGASILLMRWEKLTPLLSKVGATYEHTQDAMESFCRWVENN